MNIIKTDDGKVKVFLDSYDLEKLDIDLNTFKNQPKKAKFFLADMLAVLNDMDYFDINGDTAVDVMTNKDGGLLIIFQKEQNSQKQNTQIIYTFDRPDTLINFCLNMQLKIKAGISKSELYIYKNFYCLIIDFGLPIEIIFKYPNLRKGLSEKTAICKIREYGDFLTSTPFEKIFNL